MRRRKFREIGHVKWRVWANHSDVLVYGVSPEVFHRLLFVRQENEPSCTTG
jgi:hypothetical protein